MPSKRTSKKRTGFEVDSAADQKVALIKSDIDLSFTFVAVALASYAAGNSEEARQAANDAQKKLQSAQKELLNIHMSQDERHATEIRLKNLEQALATIEANDPGVFVRRPD